MRERVRCTLKVKAGAETGKGSESHRGEGAWTDLCGHRGDSFPRLVFRLVRHGYSDRVVLDLNRTFIVRLLVQLAKPFGHLLPFANRSSLFFFFPFMHVGGAERVHAEIACCFAGERPWVFFTKRSDNDSFRGLFPAGARLFDVWPLLKYGYPFSAGIMAGLINRHKGAVVFGGNSLFYYLLIPFLAPHVRRIDLLHAFGGASEEFSLPVTDKLDRRVVITGKTEADLAAQYRAHGIDPRLLERVVLIENRVQVPERCPQKHAADRLSVLFVGRGSPEKRLHLVGRAASMCRARGIPAEFSLVGDAGEAVAAADRDSCRFLGEVSDHRELEKIYACADVLVLTSSREGFPLVVMEAMAHGVVPVCTAVGGIPSHVRHEINGLLLEDGPEDRVVEQLADAVARLAENRRELAALSRSAFEYALRHFSGAKFCAAYREVLLGSEQKGNSQWPR